MEIMKSEKTHDTTNQTIQKISSYLVKNHLSATFEPSEWNEFIKPTRLGDLVERRVIAVVGSGASKSSGLPLASEALNILKEDSILHKKALDAELDRLSQTYKLEKGAFETHLRALSMSAFEAQNLRNNLQKMYGYRYMPALSYEVLAHMMKHRFLDAIINFNFDELLDKSIEDELNKDEYRHILSDGDCPDDIELKKTNTEIPFYIKPHGTASHKSTLRFTREDYYGLPFDIQRVLRFLLTDKPVVLIVIGFEMQSLEFNHILKNVKPESKMFHINLHDPTRKLKKEEFIQKFNSNELLRVNDKNTIGECLKNIWVSILSSFKKEYRPRDITRHILISQIFYRSVKYSDIENYLRGRTVIELCLSIAKGKGLVTMSQLSDDRSGKYFDLLRENNSEAYFYEICRLIGLKDLGYSREALRLMKEEEMVSNILDKKEFNREINFLYDRVQDNLDHISRGELSKELFSKTLFELYDGLEVELRFKPHNPYTKIFQKPKLIATYTAMKYYTQKMFKQEWKYLFVVAETGQWLVEDYFSNEILKNLESKIFLIVADTSYQDKIQKMYGRRIVSIRKLPWWEHNRHITILANENRVPYSGIYFSRRLRSANIIPVLLNNVDDTLAALESFHAYWIKASWYEKNKINEKGNWISASDSKKFIDLFNLEK
jgi:hypothetical protein